jgi:pimeloyl-ACP methyl ester carboxylesterase
MVVFLHTGVPGISPFCGSADLFADLMTTLALDQCRLVAIDLPGCGGTPPLGLQELLVDGVAQFIIETVSALDDAEEVHLVAHGQATQAALKVARSHIDTIDVRSCFLIAPNGAVPTADTVENFALHDPPRPLWSRESQKWALRRLTYAPDRVPASLLDHMVANAAGMAHIAAVELLQDPAASSAVSGARLRAQDEFYAYCRDYGYQIPVSIFWGAQDPTATVGRAAALLDIMHGGPAPLDLRVVNQCSHLAQFDRPYQLARTLENAVIRAHRGSRAARVATTPTG